MPAKKTLKILVVEDETFLAKIYDVKLKKEGFDVEIAADGEQAVGMAASFKPDLILLDLILPKMNGFEVLEKIRENSANAKTSVIVLSNLGQEADIERAAKLGVSDYLVKANFSIDEAVKKIRNVLADKKT